MSEEKYVTKEEFNELSKRFNDLVNILEGCDLKQKPDFESLNSYSDDLDFFNNQEEDDELDSNDESKNDKSIDF